MEQEIKNPENSGIKQGDRDEQGRFIKGVSGNPNGKPKGIKNFTTKVREALLKIADGKDYTYEEAFLKAILKKAIIDQDTTIMKLIWNYLDGMPTQPSIDLTPKDEPDIKKIFNELKQKAKEDDEAKDKTINRESA